MATAATWLGKLAGAASEADKRAANDRAQRLQAATILRPGEISGDYDAGRMLTTTLGGNGARPITREDLQAFARNISTGQKKFKGGITARGVLDRSTKEDRGRAQSQIHTSVAMSASNGRVRFVTNAGPDSKASRHHVTIEFLSYEAAVSAGARTPQQAANWLRKQPIRLECDCEHHRYVFRYIATIGGFNAGRPETGFPKFTNPYLLGIGCKHVIRTLAEVESSGAALQFLTRLIQRARANEGSNAILRQKQKDAEALATKPGRVRDIKTTADRKLAAAAARERRALARAVAGAQTPPMKPTAATRRMGSASGLNKAQLALLAKMGLSESQLAAVAAAGK